MAAVIIIIPVPIFLVTRHIKCLFPVPSHTVLGGQVMKVSDLLEDICYNQLLSLVGLLIHCLNIVHLVMFYSNSLETAHPLPRAPAS